MDGTERPIWSWSSAVEYSFRFGAVRFCCDYSTISWANFDARQSREGSDSQSTGLLQL